MFLPSPDGSLRNGKQPISASQSQSQSPHLLSQAQARPQLLPQSNPQPQPQSPPHTQPQPSYLPPSYSHSQTRERELPPIVFPPPLSATELAPLQLHAAHDGRSNSSLPSISSVTGQSSAAQSRFASPQAAPAESSQPSPSPAWPSLNPFTAYYTPTFGEPPIKMETDTAGSHPSSAASPQTDTGRASSVSLDDPDVRMAAEALGDLRAGTKPFW